VADTVSWSTTAPLTCLADPTLSSTYNDGFTNQARTHAGSAANGYVTAEEWVRNNTNPLLSDVPPTQARPCGRFHLNYKVRRVQIDRVQLIDANTGSVLASSSGPKNSNGARTVLHLVRCPDPLGRRRPVRRPLRVDGDPERLGDLGRAARLTDRQQEPMGPPMGGPVACHEG
jgi:hypothetical protein